MSANVGKTSNGLVQPNGLENRPIPRSNSSPDLSCDNYQAQSIWMKTAAEPKAIAYDAFMKQARRRQFRHIFVHEPKIPRPKK